MKKSIIATIALAVSLCASAQQWEQTTPDARVYIEIDGGDPTNLALGICYENTTGEDLCGLECTLELPKGVNVLRNASGGEALNSNHIYMKNYYEHSRTDGTNCWLFTCFSRAADVAAKRFVSDGRVATLFLDVSALSEGRYNITVSKALLVWTDGYRVVQLKTADAGYELNLSSDYAQGTVSTEVKGVAEEDINRMVSPSQRGIYTLQGVKVDRTQPGGIYIINGRKMVVK